jgi:hypothetical protein
MKRAITYVILLFVFLGILVPIPTFGVSDLIYWVSPADPTFSILTNYQAKIKADCEKEHWNRPVFYPWSHGTTNSISILFPKLRFAWMFWSESPIPNAKEQSPKPTKNSEVTLAIDATTGEIVGELHESGDQAAFGKLLALNSIAIKNEADATLIWRAFCEAHLHFLTYRFETEPSKKVSDNEWHLGNYICYETISDANGIKKEMMQTSYLKVIIDPETGKIILCRRVLVNSKEFTGGMVKYQY